MATVAGVAGRIQAQQPVGCLTSGFKGVPVLPAGALPKRSPALRKMSTKIQAVASEPALERPDATGRFGRFGGKYVPETLITALAELEQAYAEAMNDPAFTVSRNAIQLGFIKFTSEAVPIMPSTPLPPLILQLLDYFLAGGVGLHSQGLCWPS